MNFFGRNLSRRTVLGATGATVAAGYVGSQLANASTAEAGAVVGGAVGGAAPGGQLVTYPIPDGIAQNSSFTVKVRKPGGSWQRVATYLTQLKMIDPKTGSGQVYDSSLGYFDFSGTVEVSVTYAKGIDRARIRPLSYGIEPTVNENTVRFTLDQPRRIVVEVNDEVFDCLHLFANPIEAEPPSPDDPDVIHYGPGVHTTANGTLTVPSGKTVYLAGGAVLKSKLIIQDVENVRVTGRGMVYGANDGACLVYGSKHINIDGVTSLNNPTGYAITVAESEQVAITNFGYFSAGKWADGIDIFCSSDVLIDGCFLRTADDSIALYTHRWDYYGDTRNITVSNCTLWADVAHPINMGTHGNTQNPEVIENITVHNVDILDHREPQKLYQGCIALNPGDSNLVRNVRIDDVRVEDFRWGQFVHMRVAYNRTYNTSVGRGIESVYIKNLSYAGENAETALMLGYDESHGIKDVTFQNLVVNGTVIADTMQKPSWYLTSDLVPMHVNEHVANLRFLKADEKPTDQKPTVTGAGSTELTKDAPCIYTITATGFSTEFAADGLPNGLELDKATGVISGVPAATAEHPVVVSATNDVGTATKTITFTVGS